jgi:multiple sugar transport system permease protein
MKKIPYYVKKRITNTIISVFMMAFLALTILPIGWMVYSSLKDSTDIAIGKVGLRTARTNILLVEPVKDNLLVLSADGGINYYRAKDLERLKHKSYKAAAASYVLDDKYIWMATANRGLFRIDRDNIKKSKNYKYPLHGFDFHKVPSTYIREIGNDVFVSLDYKGFNGALRFDKNNMSFMELIKGAKKRYFPDAGIIRTEEFPGVDGEVFSKATAGKFLFLGASSGKLYKYNLATNKMVKMIRIPRGHILVRWYNYVDMWKNVNFGLYLRNSIIICGFTMLIAMVFSTLAAYALSRFRFPGSDLFSNSILATQMIPAIMYLIPLYIMFVRFTMMTGIPVKGTFTGMILIYSAFFIPFSIWILRGFFASIPRQLEEAALIDGCSRFQVFWHIALPLALPGVIATGIYVFLTAWDELMFAWVLTNADTMTIPVGIRLFVGNYQNRFDLMMAAATVATIPVVVLFFTLQKHIVKGLTSGAVKG